MAFEDETIITQKPFIPKSEGFSLRVLRVNSEFVQREWVSDGKFIGAPPEKDPLVSSNDGREFTIPKQPIRRHLKGLPTFVVNRGGEYCFMPGLRALRWLADLDT